MAPTLSVVVPVFDEADNLDELHRRLVAILDGLGLEWEVVLVDDGSTDGSGEKIAGLAGGDSRVRAVHLARNFGHQIAVTAGLDVARGDAVVIMDADLQDPPEVIPELVDRWRDGYEIVYAQRTAREGESRFKQATASAFYRTLRWLTDIDIPVDAGDFRLLDRRTVEVLRRMPERHRFLRGMTAWTGMRQTAVPYQRARRFAGSTHYPTRRMARLAISAVTSFSHVPLQVATVAGFVVGSFTVALIPVVIALRVAGVEGLGGQTTTLIAVLFLGSVQLVSLGLLGEYVGRIYDEVKRRPLYVTRDGGPLPRDLSEEKPGADGQP